VRTKRSVAVQGTTPLHNAVRRQSFTVCKLLLGAGANINARDNQVGACA